MLLLLFSLIDFKNFRVPVITMLLLLLSLIGFTSATRSSVLVKLNETVTLNCSQPCSDLVTWTRPNMGGDTVAWCNQTSCKAEKGFEISYDKYLKEIQSLTITQADFSKRTWYSCNCDNKEVCALSLRIKTVNHSLHVQPGESVNLHLPISEDVDLFLNWTEHGSMKSKRLCWVIGREIECEDEYKDQVSLNCSIKLDKVKIGTYILKDRKNEEVILGYTVTAEGKQPDEDNNIMMLYVVIKVLGVLLLFAFIGLVVQFRKIRKLQECMQSREDPGIPMDPVNEHQPVMETENGLIIQGQNVPQQVQDDVLDVKEPLLQGKEHLPPSPHPFVEDPLMNIDTNRVWTRMLDEQHHSLVISSAELPQPVLNEQELSLSISESCPQDSTWKTF